MEESNKHYAYLLMQIENWKQLKEELSNHDREILESSLSDIFRLKYGDNFRSILLHSGELFLILKNEAIEKTILKTSGEIKHQLKSGYGLIPQKLEVSIVIATRPKFMDSYEVLLYLRKVLNICKKEQTKDILCVA
ncbi:MAG: hypothetical protein R8P61_16750 [Bacteroidia bacterium]|nr:hypothetical protein [Bacteroidia bacterium]